MDDERSKTVHLRANDHLALTPDVEDADQLWLHARSDLHSVSQCCGEHFGKLVHVQHGSVAAGTLKGGGKAYMTRFAVYWWWWIRWIWMDAMLEIIDIRHCI